MTLSLTQASESNYRSTRARVMASTKLAVFLFLCLQNLIATTGAIQKCIPLRDGPLAKCSVAGYNSSFPIPRTLSQRSLAAIKATADFLIKIVQNCSVGRIGETMVCSYLAPHCKESNSSPLLPCKRVCSEFLKRCEDVIPDFAVDLLVALCSMLQNSTASQGTCYEPPNFHVHYNSTYMGPLERSCTPVIIPFCQGLGYNHTLLTYERQKKIYKHMYDKNYTNDANVAIPANNGSSIYWISYLMKNYSKCSKDFTKLFCAEHIPPCFPGEGLSFYTICKDVCMDIVSRCPGLITTRLKYFLYCERLAFGEPYKGFCRHKEWPPPMKWIDFFKRSPPSKPPKPAGGVGGGVIAAVIIIPVIIVGTAIALVFFYKKRQLTSHGYSRQEDDRADLVI